MKIADRDPRSSWSEGHAAAQRTLPASVNPYSAGALRWSWQTGWDVGDKARRVRELRAALAAGPKRPAPQDVLCAPAGSAEPMARGVAISAPRH